MKIPRLLFVLLLALTFAGLAPAHAAPPVAEAKARATRALELLKSGEFEQRLEYSYPTEIEEAGGREKSLALARAAAAQMKAKSIKVLSISVGDPTEPLTSGDKTFVLLPVEMMLDTPQATVTLKGHWLAIATGDGPWLFIDSQSLTPEKLKTLVPDLPAGLKIPEKIEPVVVPK